MLELLKTFNPDSRILLKVFPDNVNCKYMNEVIGKRCFEMMEQNQDGDDSFSQFALRYCAVAITPGSTCRRKKIIMISLSDFSILLMQLTLQVIFVGNVGYFAHVTNFLVFNLYLYL